jgi:hypothetical protein
MIFVGANFDFALAPGRTVQGTVKDKATGRPIAGARVVSEKVANHNISGRDDFQATTDQDGKFTLHGLPLGKGNVLRAAPPDGQPNLPQLREVPVPDGANAAPVDFDLTRGVTMTVKVIDKATKAPVTAMVEYFTFPDNPALKEIKGFTVSDSQRRQTRATRHEIVVPPGPGLIAVRSMDERYPVAVGLDQFKDRMRGPFIETRPYLCHATNFHILVPVEPKADAQTTEVEVALDSGATVKGRVLGPDGKPLAGAIARGLKSAPLAFGVWEKEPLASAEFEAVGVDSKQPRIVIFLHTEKKLGGVARVSGKEKGPVEVKLKPWASITGRLVNPDGKPMADVRLGFVQKLNEPDPTSIGDLPSREYRTDKDGRFTVEGFVPGLRYNFVAFGRQRVLADIGGEGLQFEAGQEKNVGDVKIREDGE